MDGWLAAVEADDSSAPLADKIVADRPADVTDRCVVAELSPVCDVEELQVLQTRLSTPRQEAGGPPANDNVACVLKPLDRAEFDPASSRSPTRSGPARGRSSPTASATGRCPAAGQGPAETWLRYGPRNGAPAYGGRNLPVLPAHSGTGLTSPAFQEALRR